MTEKTPIGKYIQPGGTHSFPHKAWYYGIRYNQRPGNYSNIPLGLQVLILFLGSYMWINIKSNWL